MSKKFGPKNFTTVRVVAADAAVQRAVQRALVDAGVTHVVVLQNLKSGLTKEESEGGCLLIAPEGGLPEGILGAVSRTVASGGWVGVWGDFENADGAAISDEWIASELLRQHGASVSQSLAALALAVRFHPAVHKSTVSGVSVQGRTNGVSRRLKRALVACGVEVLGGKQGLVLRVDEPGRITVPDSDVSEAFLEPLIVAEAVRLVLNSCIDCVVSETIEALRPEDVALIAQPPPRLLSETASKKLFAAFGMSLPQEQLCQSPSEAARFVAARTGPSVLKLVKPRLSGKERLGAVLRGVSGAAAARRAAQRLMSLSASMGPPDALGVLASEQVEGGVRLWVAMRIHPSFGRLVTLGIGDTPNGRLLSAFQAPATVSEVLRVLHDSDVGADSGAADKIARAVARFSAIVHQLSGRICRAEIHPLVAVSSHPEALVLDALAEIGPDENAAS